MENSKYFKNLNTLQKIGYVLIILAGVLTLLRILKIMPRDYYTTHDLRNYMYLVGAFLLIIPKIKKIF